MLSDGEAATIAITIQSLLTGVQLITFISSLLFYFFPNDGSNIRKRIPWLIITILVMAFSIIDLAGTLRSRLLGLEGNSGQLPTSVIVVRILICQLSSRFPELAADYIHCKDFRDNWVGWCSGSWIEALSLVDLCSRPFFQIYRCWVVYGKRWQIAVFPLLLVLYNFLCIFVVIYLTAASGPEIKVIPFTEIYYNPQIDVLDATFVVATIVINVYATCTFLLSFFLYNRAILKRLCFWQLLLFIKYLGIPCLGKIVV